MSEKELKREVTETYAFVVFGILDESDYVNFIETVEDLGFDSDPVFIEHVKSVVDGFEACKKDMKKCKQWQGRFNTAYPSKVYSEITNDCLRAMRNLQPVYKELFINRIRREMK